MPTDDLIATNELLNAELPDVRYSTRTPATCGGSTRRTPSVGRTRSPCTKAAPSCAHYALLPQTVPRRGRADPGRLLLARGDPQRHPAQGVFRRSRQRSLRRRRGRRPATAHRAPEREVGRRRGRSTSGGDSWGRCPVRICIPTRLPGHREVETIPCTPELLGERSVRRADAGPRRLPGDAGSRTSGPPESLRWRLARPRRRPHPARRREVDRHQHRDGAARRAAPR